MNIADAEDTGKSQRYFEFLKIMSDFCFIAIFLQTYLSMKRIDEFLNSEELVSRANPVLHGDRGECERDKKAPTILAGNTSTSIEEEETCIGADKVRLIIEIARHRRARLSQIKLREICANFEMSNVENENFIEKKRTKKNFFSDKSIRATFKSFTFFTRL